MGGKCSKSKPPRHQNIEPSPRELGGDDDAKNKNSEEPQQQIPPVAATAEGETFAMSAASASASTFSTSTSLSVIIVDNRLVADTENQTRVETTLSNLLQGTDRVTFNKPDLEVFNESMLYQITLGEGNDTVALYVVKRSPSRFQPRRDIILLTSDGQTVLRLINPKRLLHKVKVFMGNAVIGSIVKSRLNMCKPAFRIRDREKKDVAVVVSRTSYCCTTLQKLCCSDNFGVFEALGKANYRPKSDDDGQPMKTDGKLLGIIYRDITFNDRASHDGLIEIQFRNDPPALVDTTMKCLLIAAAIFIDFSVFVPQEGESDVKVIIVVGLSLLVFLGVVILSVVYIT